MGRNQSIVCDKFFGVIAALCCATFAISPVLAQTDSSLTEGQWQYAAAIYLWGADLGGKTLSGSEVEVGFSDLVENLEFGAMSSFTARKNRWSVLADMIYLDLGVDKTAELSVPVGPIQVPVTTAVSLDVEGWVLHLAGGYELYSEGASRLDLIGGARYMDFSMDMFLELQSLGPGQSRTVSASLSSFDGIVGLNGNASLGEKWNLPYYVDIGTGESEFTWQASAGVMYQAGTTVNVALVYRHLEWDIDDSARVIDDINFSGPMLGVVFHW